MTLLTRTPYIIAEAGVNHNGQFDLAVQLIDAACRAGADCVKFQAFTAAELTLKSAPKAEYQKHSGAPSDSQYDMLKKLELAEEAFIRLKSECDRRTIDFLATPFSAAWVDKLARMGVKAIKIGSGDATSSDILTAAARTGLPVILSTGMSDMQDIFASISILRQGGAREIYLLHCVSLYPTRLDQVNLGAIETLGNLTRLPIGLSDHTEADFTGALATAAGAVILEKHFTLDKNLPGPDHRMSLEPIQLAEYIRLARLAAIARGNGNPAPLPEETAIKQAARKSIVAAVSIQRGQTLTQAMLAFKRPGTGIPATDIAKVIGTRARCDIAPDTLLHPDMLEFSPHE